MSIPATIIQTARSRDLPPMARAAETNLKLLHPDWEFRFFDDDDVRRFVSAEFPGYRTVFESFPKPIQRFDFFRYLAVYRHGGFYLDLDVFLFRGLHPLLGRSAVFPFEELSLNRHLRRAHGIDWEIGNYAFGAAAGSPFLLAVIENCVRAQRDPAWLQPMMAGMPWVLRPEFAVLYSTGPGLLTRTLIESPDHARQVSVLFPRDVCDASNWDRFGDYGVHLMAGTWRERWAWWRRRLAGRTEARLLRAALAESRRLGPLRRFPPAAGEPAEVAGAAAAFET